MHSLRMGNGGPDTRHVQVHVPDMHYKVNLSLRFPSNNTLLVVVVLLFSTSSQTLNFYSSLKAETGSSSRSTGSSGTQ